MTDPRISPIDPPYTEDVQDAFDKIMPPGRDPLIIFRTFAHNPAILRRQMALGASLLTSDRLSALDREIVILRTCAVCGSEYEWGVHVTAFARPLGMSKAAIEATVTGTAEDNVWSGRQALLIRFVDQLHEASTVDDELWEALAAIWSPQELVELLCVCGMYHAVSFTTNATRMNLEADAARFPAKVS